MKKSIVDIRKKLNSIRGEILSGATEIESALGWRLRTYFFPKTNQQSSIFYWDIINDRHFGFDKKISLYEKIPYFKRLKQYPKMIKALRLVQKLRNSVAHWDLEIGASSITNIILWNPSNLKRIHLDKNILQEFRDSEIYILKNFRFKEYLNDKYNNHII